MEPARQRDLANLRARLAAHEPWVAGPGAKGFGEALMAARRRLKKYRGRGPVVVAEIKPAKYLATVLVAVEKRMPIVLANPRWGVSERIQAASQIMPGIWFGEKAARWPLAKPTVAFNPKDWKGVILIPTGGSSGGVRWAMHTWTTLAAAAHALVGYLDARGCVHVSTLPPWHVSGLMPAVRALESGGTLWLESWKTLERGSTPKISPEKAIISLVPTQIQRLLKHKKVVAWLKGTKAILLGGASPSPELFRKLRKLRLPIALAYGMTETAAAVAVQRPADLLAGARANPTILPHATIRADNWGRFWIQASSLFHGYYPVLREPGEWPSEDYGPVFPNGQIWAMGRFVHTINTGGEKVQPADVEQQILATGLVRAVRVIGRPDAEWGERVVAVYTGEKIRAKKLRSALKGRLSDYALPKEWVWSKKLPQGKVIG